MTLDELRAELAPFEALAVAAMRDATTAVETTLARSMEALTAVVKLKDASLLAAVREARPIRVDTGQLAALQASEAAHRAKVQPAIAALPSCMTSHRAQTRDHAQALGDELARLTASIVDRVVAEREADRQLIVALRCERIELQARIGYLERTYEPKPGAA